MVLSGGQKELICFKKSLKGTEAQDFDSFFHLVYSMWGLIGHVGNSKDGTDSSVGDDYSGKYRFMVLSN
jgi:hypothetical protein